ncbi:MAG: cyclopropane-fatty-acyl-phospholipid synthase [Halioglobus sp.]|jgi:cyclopropane-fatty-acyl-phospholipid synthase
MSELSVGSVKLPQKRSAKLGEKLAREVMFKVFGELTVGSLALHEGPESYHFGDAGNAIQAEVHIHSPAAYSAMVTGGSIGSAEAYIEELWSSPSLLEVTRLFSANMVALDSMESKRSWPVRLATSLGHRLQRNTSKGSRQNIAAHYDLGNTFFELFLDPKMMYSSALFEGQQKTLEAASTDKLHEICVQLDLRSDDHLIEIGTGWGGMAIYAAKEFGCKVTTTTISAEQYEYACAAVKHEGLEDQITLLFDDYRDLTGQYDKLVSIEMIEAVGHEFYKNYFEVCSSLLKEDGIMVIQAITVADQRYAQAKDSVDFIQRYIFPGGCLPSVAVIAGHVSEDTDMQIVHLRDITQDYAQTLSVWRERFMNKLDEVHKMGFDQQFIRMWEFYLCYCEGGFSQRIIGTVQLAIAKPGYRFRPAETVGI